MSSTPHSRPVLSLVVPAFNEEGNVAKFIASSVAALEGIGESFEIVFVDDGSRDQTLGLLLAAASQDARLKVVALARNFGKDIALTAGLAHARGDAVIPIDCDLQHPVELIGEFVTKWRAGAEMVVGVRSSRSEEGLFRRWSARAYYRFMQHMTDVAIPANAGDFRLIDRKIVDAIGRMPERHRFMKGIFAWPGFRTDTVPFVANPRAASTWRIGRLWRFALDGLFSFSTAPLKIWTYVGVLTACGAFVYLGITIFQKFYWGIAAPGYASLLVLLLFFNGLALISNGIQGEYIGRIYEEVKRRPLYVVSHTHGFDEASITQGAATQLQEFAAVDAKRVERADSIPEKAGG